MTTLKVDGAGFDGYLEMAVEPTRAAVGQPALRVIARFPQYEDPARPPVGTIAALVEAAGAIDGATAQQALSMAPTAPSRPEIFSIADQPQAQSTEPAVLGQDVGVSGRPAGTSGPDVPHLQTPQLEVPGNPGLPADVRDDPGALGSTATKPATSSPFWVDAWVMSVAPCNLILQHLVLLQSNKVKGGFPVGTFRNYNCWACGYQQTTGDWHEAHLWGPIPDKTKPPLLDDILVCMKKLWEEKNHPVWCWGVGMLVKFLEHLQAKFVWK